MNKKKQRVATPEEIRACLDYATIIQAHHLEGKQRYYKKLVRAFKGQPDYIG